MKFILDVYVIVDLGFARGRGLEVVVNGAILGGASIIQLRDKRATTRALVDMAEKAQNLCRRAGIPLIINDRVDVAMAVDADGVHLGPDDMPVAAARKLLGGGKIIGASTETVEKGLAARRDGSDYLGVGPIYATATKTDAGEPVDLAILGLIKKSSTLPVVGIGGINQANAAPVIAAGADGVAVISAAVGAPDIAAAVHALRQAVQQAKLSGLNL